MFESVKTILGLAALGFMLLGGPVAAETKSPIVVELYTSQGCSSCPPAEAFLGELADRPGVLALEFHVDYWDYIGWKDPFGSHENVDRQRGYSAKLGERYVYTPQMVIHGRSDEVGSKRYQVEKQIETIRATVERGPDVRLERSGDTVRVTVGGDHASGTYDVIFVTFDGHHETKVLRGENRGRTLVNRNIVRDFDRVGQWSGQPIEIDVSLADKKGDGGCAVIVQEPQHGPVIAAAILAEPGS